jgi:hypothetical protein
VPAAPTAETELLVVERAAGDSPSQAAHAADTGAAQASDVTLREMYGPTREPKRGMFSFLRG